MSRYLKLMARNTAGFIIGWIVVVWLLASSGHEILAALIFMAGVFAGPWALAGAAVAGHVTAKKQVKNEEMKARLEAIRAEEARVDSMRQKVILERWDKWTKQGHFELLKSEPEVYSGESLEVEMRPVPDLTGGVKGFLSDGETLQQYMGYLDERRKTTETVLKDTVEGFRDDHEMVRQQQRWVLDEAMEAGSVLARWPELPRLRPESADISQRLALEIPRSPTYLTFQEYSKKYRVQWENLGSSIAQTFARQGASATTVEATLVALAIGAVLEKSLVSRGLRVAHDARGTMQVFAQEAAGTARILGSAHKALTEASERLYEASAEIARLKARVTQIPPAIRSLDGLETGVRQEVIALWYWVMSAKQVSQQASA